MQNCCDDNEGAVRLDPILVYYYYVFMFVIPYLIYVDILYNKYACIVYVTHNDMYYNDNII